MTGCGSKSLLKAKITYSPFIPRSHDDEMKLFRNDDILCIGLFGEEPGQEDRRASQRIPISIPVRYKVKRKSLFSFWHVAETIDYSKNSARLGVRLFSTKLISVDAKVEMDLKLPGEMVMSRYTGRIIWVRPKKNGYECGVAFHDFKHASAKEKLISFVTEKMCNSAEHYFKNIQASPVANPHELKSAYQLTYSEYLKRGYCDSNPSKMHYNYFALLPDSRTFVLKKDDMIMGTVSLIVDSRCGLPMETLFPHEIDRLRLPDRRIAEVSLLALDLSALGHKTFSLTDFEKMTCLFKLFKTLFDYARLETSVTDLVMCMHPKHQTLYKYLTFETIGEVKTYPGACNKPALPMRMNILKSVSEISIEHGKGNFFLKSETPREILKKKVDWSPALAEEFLYQQQHIFDKIPIEHRSYFADLYLERRPQ
jgi:hypothetical protein